MTDKQKPEYICKSCKNRMHVKEFMNNASNEYKRCLYDPEINCDSVIECNKYEEIDI